MHPGAGTAGRDSWQPWNYKDKEIILIGETLDGWGDDARLLWELRAAGYEDVKMVDGGWKALKDSGIKTQFLASKPEPAEVKIDEIDYSHVMTTEELQKNYDEYKCGCAY